MRNTKNQNLANLKNKSLSYMSCSLKKKSLNKKRYKLTQNSRKMNTQTRAASNGWMKMTRSLKLISARQID